jgi:hypothetical protein
MHVPDFTIVHVKVMITHATSYDVLVAGAVLYPLGVTLDFWEEIAYYRLGWQIKDSHKAFLEVNFIRGCVGKSNNSTMLVGFSRLFDGFDLLKGNVHVMDNLPAHELEMLGAQVRPFMQGSSHDPPPSWGTLLELQASTEHYIH